MLNSDTLASSRCKMIDFCSVFKIVSMSSSEMIESRSKITSLRSIETTSPVSSSTKSSVHVRNTRAARRRPIAFFKASRVPGISSDKPKRLRMSLSEPKPIARSNVVTGNFFLRSMYAYITLFTSVENSIHEPFIGITRAE